MTESLVIVGGTGFIGGHLAKRAIDCGFKTYVLSLNPPSESQKIQKVEYIQADISNLEELNEKLVITAYDYVVNLSGYVNHSSYLDGGRSVVDCHFNGVQNLLEVIDWSSLKRFVQIGTSDEYGNHLSPQSEKMPPSPISPYALAKTSSSNLLQMLYHSENFPAVILRLFLVYGPNQNNLRFLPQIIKGCINGDSFPVSAGNQIRDFCYVEDIIDGILMTFNKNEANGEVINLASGMPISIKNAIEIVQKIIGKGGPVFDQIPYREGENMSLYADITKAKKIINWQPKTSFSIGIKKTIQFFEKQ